MTDETYQGHVNRESWAFDLHWSNDEGLYNLVRDWGSELIGAEDAEESQDVRDYRLGETVIERMHEFLLDPETGNTDGCRMMLAEVGSFWRVDKAEVGASVRESVDD